MRIPSNFWVMVVVAASIAGVPNRISAAQSSSSQPQGSVARPEAGKAVKPGDPAAALDHLMKAKAALDAVPSVSGDAATKLAEVRRQFEALERSYRSGGSKTISTEKTQSDSNRVRIVQKADWRSRVPEIDRLLGDLLASKSGLEAAARPKLGEMRKQLTAFAVAANGTFGLAPPAAEQPRR